MWGIAYSAWRYKYAKFCVLWNKRGIEVDDNFWPRQLWRKSDVVEYLSSVAAAWCWYCGKKWWTAQDDQLEQANAHWLRGIPNIQHVLWQCRKLFPLYRTSETLNYITFLKKVNEHASYQMTVKPNFRISDESSIDGHLCLPMIKKIL